MEDTVLPTLKRILFITQNSFNSHGIMLMVITVYVGCLSIFAIMSYSWQYNVSQLSLIYASYLHQLTVFSIECHRQGRGGQGLLTTPPCYNTGQNTAVSFAVLCSWVLSHSVVSNSLLPHILCTPLGSSVHGDSPSKNT